MPTLLLFDADGRDSRLHAEMNEFASSLFSRHPNELVALLNVNHPLETAFGPAAALQVALQKLQSQRSCLALIHSLATFIESLSDEVTCYQIVWLTDRCAFNPKDEKTWEGSSALLWRTCLSRNISLHMIHVGNALTCDYQFERVISQCSGTYAHATLTPSSSSSLSSCPSSSSSSSCSSCSSSSSSSFSCSTSSLSSSLLSYLCVGASPVIPFSVSEPKPPEKISPSLSHAFAHLLTTQFATFQGRLSVGRAGQAVCVSPAPSLAKVRLGQASVCVPLPSHLQVHGFLSLTKLSFPPVLVRFALYPGKEDGKQESNPATTPAATTATATTANASTNASTTNASSNVSSSNVSTNASTTSLSATQSCCWSTAFPEIAETGFLAALAETLGDSLCALVVFPSNQDQSSWLGYISCHSPGVRSLVLSILHPHQSAPWFQPAFTPHATGAVLKRKTRPSYALPMSEVDPHPDVIAKHREKIAKYLHVPNKAKSLEEACEKVLEISETFALDGLALNLKEQLQAAGVQSPWLEPFLSRAFSSFQ